MFQACVLLRGEAKRAYCKRLEVKLQHIVFLCRAYHIAMIFFNRSKSVFFFNTRAQWALQWVGCGMQLPNDAKASSISHKHFSIIGKRYHSIRDALLAFVCLFTAYLIVVFHRAMCQKKTTNRLIYYD